jgi:hypothetical protein
MEKVKIPHVFRHESFSLPFLFLVIQKTASVVLWSEFLATDPEVPGSISSPTRFSEK